MLLMGVGTRLFLMFARALHATEAERNLLAHDLKALTAEFDVRVEAMTAQRVEQFTERERKRIASDLHDDLGAKLLTIVHTSDSARVPQLAREALEEMRLSVRGLAGRPVRLDDALADWRAETMVRLGQANIEALWDQPEVEPHMLPARLFMQLTRVLREAVSNVIKHSEATRCEIRCLVAGRKSRRHRARQRPRHRRRPAPRTGHVEHETARQEDERAVPGRVATRVRRRDIAHGAHLSPRRRPGGACYDSSAVCAVAHGACSFTTCRSGRRSAPPPDATGGSR